MKHLIVLVAIGSLIADTFAAVGTTCSDSGNECAGTIETCDVPNLKCVCADNHINKGDGTCVTNNCATATACTTNAIQNSYCGASSVCICDSLSEVSTADDATKGACVVKACTGDGTECDSITNAKCSVTTAGTSGTCICNDGYTLTEGVCAAQSSAGMVAASLGALLFALLLKVSLL